MRLRSFQGTIGTRWCSPPGAESEPSFAFVGFGALAEAFAKGLRDGGARDVAVFARPRRDAEAADALRRRLAAAGVRSCPSVEDTPGTRT